MFSGLGNLERSPRLWQGLQGVVECKSGDQVPDAASSSGSGIYTAVVRLEQPSWPSRRQTRPCGPRVHGVTVVCESVFAHALHRSAARAARSCGVSH